VFKVFKVLPIYTSTSSSSGRVSCVGSVVFVDSGLRNGLVDVLREVCRYSGLLCYEPMDSEEVLSSLVWVESLTHVNSLNECFNSLERLEGLGRSFAESLKKALKNEYVITVDLSKVKEVSEELKNLKT